MGEGCSLKGAFVSLTEAGKKPVRFLWACLPDALGVSEAAPLPSREQGPGWVFFASPGCVGVTPHPCLSGGGVGSGNPWAVVVTFTNPGRRELGIRKMDTHDISLPVSAGAGVEVKGFLTPTPGSFFIIPPSISLEHCATKRETYIEPRAPWQPITNLVRFGLDQL